MATTSGLNALLPVASMAHITLGISTLILLSKSRRRAWNEYMAALLMAWIMIFLGIRYAMSSYIDYLAVTGQVGELTAGPSEVFYTWYNYFEEAIDFAYHPMIAMLAIIFPLPLLQHRFDQKRIFLFIVVCWALLIPFTIYTEFSHRDILRAIASIGWIVWIFIHIRYIIGEVHYEEKHARILSGVSVLLLLAIYGKWAIFGLGDVFQLNNAFRSQSIVIDIVPQSYLSGMVEQVNASLNSLTLLALVFGEGYRTYKKGIDGYSWLVFGFFLIAMIWLFALIFESNSALQCVETVCTPLSPLATEFYIFTAQTIQYLLAPILFMFVILNFDLIDTTNNDSNKTITRFMVLMLLIIATSSVIELIQLLLPISDVVTSAMFGIGIIGFIGWEERITSKLMIAEHSVSTAIEDSGVVVEQLDVNENIGRLFLYGALAVIFYAFLLSMFGVNYWGR